MSREMMQSVELSDESADEASTEPTSGDLRRAASTTYRRTRRRRRLLIAAATLAVGLVGTQVILDTLERAQLARLAAVPGVLAPVDESIHTLWSSSDWGTIYSVGAGAFGDLGIGGHLDDAGERTARAVRSRTGEVVWTTVLRPAEPTAPALGTPSAPSCTVDAGAPQVVCLVSDAARLDTSDGSVTAVPATFARLVVLDPTTGAVIAQHDEPISAALSVAVLDGLAVVASRSDTGHLVVVAEDPRSGEARWRFESSAALADAVPFTWSTDPAGLELSVVAGHVAVTAAGGEAWVLSADGDLVGDAVPGHVTRVEVVRRTRVAIVDYGPTGSDSPTMRIVAGGGSLGAASDQLLVPLQVDDGSVPDLLFTMSDTLLAWDLRTGELAWTGGFSVSSSSVLLDGRLILRTSGGRLVALDAKTGAMLWNEPLLTGPDSSIATDGRSILASEPSPTGPSSLVAFATDDGHRRWEVPLPASVAYVWPMGRQLIGVSQDGDATAVLG